MYLVIKAAMVAIGIFSLPVAAHGQSANSQGPAGENEICVLNASEKEHIFAVEIINGEREIKTLSKGEKLCISDRKSVV